MRKIAVLVDWSQAFVDPDGSFYCGATQAEKHVACRVVEQCDVVVNFTDVHSLASKEFHENGGRYPPHNLVDRDNAKVSKNASARLTHTIQDAVDRKHLVAGLVVPTNVLHQDGPAPMDLHAIRETFDNLPLVVSPENTAATYLVSCKHFFDGTALQRLPHGDLGGEFTAATVLQFRHGDGADVLFLVTGVVTAICVFNTAAGLRQMFPRARVVIVQDACHSLVGAEFGLAGPEHTDAVVGAMCRQIGVEYLPLSAVFEDTK